MTNRDRIIAALNARGPLDDDELSLLTGVNPRQQVNQICRGLESAGLLTRRAGPRGKLVNAITGSNGDGVSDASFRIAAVLSAPPRISLDADSIGSNPERTLFIIPCSARKSPGGTRAAVGPGIGGFLPDELRDRLLKARIAIRNSAKVNEELMMAAAQRYQGHLYEAARPALGSAIAQGLNVLIVSGGYGLVLASEPIGTYEAVFQPSAWPSNLLNEVLLAYVAARALKHVRSFVSATTSYRRLLEQVPWASVGVKDALLIAPRAGLGAMVKAPRAEGEAFSAAVLGTLTRSRQSSDGLELEVIRLK